MGKRNMEEMTPIIRSVASPIPVAGQSIEEMFRITTTCNTRSRDLFNVEALIIVAPRVDFELNLMYNTFKMTRVSIEVVVQVLRRGKRCRG